MRFGYRVIMLSAAIIALLMLILLAMRVPARPMLISPPDGAVERSGTAVEFTWRYGGYVYRYPVIWRTPQHYVVCVKEYAPGDFPCSYPPGPPDPIQPPRADVVTGFRSVSGAPNSSLAEAIRHYTHQIDNMPTNLRDMDLMWTVAAYASTSPDSCSVAVPQRRLRIANLNLTMEEAEIDIVPSAAGMPPDVSLSGRFSNDSAVATGQFVVRLQAAQLRIDSSQSPIKNLTGLVAADEIMLKNGLIMTLPDFQNSMYVSRTSKAYWSKTAFAQPQV